MDGVGRQQVDRILIFYCSLIEKFCLIKHDLVLIAVDTLGWLRWMKRRVESGALEMGCTGILLD